jgi:hypothetical protein
MIILSKGSLTQTGRFAPETMALNLSERGSTATITFGIGTVELAIGDWLQDDTDPGAGIVWRVKTIDTQYNTSTVTVQLEDMVGTTEVLVFPKVYERVSPLLEQDAPVVMAGKLSVREDESPKLLLDRLAPLDELDSFDAAPRGRRWNGYAPEPWDHGALSLDDYGAPPPDSGYDRRPARGNRKLYLKLTADTRQEVLRILSETPGSICVMLYMADERKTYQAPREYWVDEGYDFGALANLIGADNIVLKG